MSISVAQARQVLQAQPFSRLLAAELLAFSGDGVALRIPIREDTRQQNGFVHGGVVSYMADNALTFAGGAVLGAAVVTSEYKINYVRPAVGDWLVARAHAVHAGRRQATCRAEIFTQSGEQEQLCAIAQGTIVRTGEPAPAHP